MKDHCPFCGEDREDYLCPSCEKVFENTEFKDECPEFTFGGKKFTAYLKPDNKYDIYMDELLVAMAVKEELMKLLIKSV